MRKHWQQKPSSSRGWLAAGDAHASLVSRADAAAAAAQSVTCGPFNFCVDNAGWPSVDDDDDDDDEVEQITIKSLA